MLSLLLCVHLLTLWLDLGKSLDRREGESAYMIIHKLQSSGKKSDDAYLTTPVLTWAYLKITTLLSLLIDDSTNKNQTTHFTVLALLCWNKLPVRQ